MVSLYYLVYALATDLLFEVVVTNHLITSVIVRYPSSLLLGLKKKYAYATNYQNIHDPIVLCPTGSETMKV